MQLLVQQVDVYPDRAEVRIRADGLSPEKLYRPPPEWEEQRRALGRG